MKKLISFLFFCCLCLTNALAADYVLDKELTWEQVKDGKTAFVLVSNGNVLYGDGNGAQDCAYGSISNISETTHSVYWKVESGSTYSAGSYMFRAYTLSGEVYNFWGRDGYNYLNSNPGGDVVFILGANGKNEETGATWTGGQDMANGAVWTVTSATGGYYIKNVGNNTYLNGTNTSASADKVWKFYSIKVGAVTDIYGDDAGTDSGLRPIRRYGKNLVYADDANTPVVLHGVMDTPSAYFNKGRWTNGIGWADYNNTANIAPCLNYFTKIFEAINKPSKGTYCNLFRLHLDPCWVQDDNLVMSGFQKKTRFNSTTNQDETYYIDPHGKEVGGEANVARFSETKFRARLQDLYVPLIKDAIAHGLYVIVRPPGVFPDDIVVGDYYNEYLKTIWNIISNDSYIKAHAGQISLELGNEPVHIWEKGTTDFSQPYWQYNVANRTDLYDFFQPIVDIIRSNGFKGIIWAPGTGYQAEYQSYSKKMLNDSNLGFAAHFYPGWYNSTSNDEQCKNSDANVLNQFKTQLPVQASYPIVITEVDWSPKDGAGGHYDEHGNWVVSNYGTWGTGSTTTNSRFGEQYKYVVDQCGNVSWTLQGAPLYVDIDAYLKDGTVQPAFLAKAKANNVDIYEACSGATFKWFREYAGGTVEWDPSSSGGNDGEPTDLTASMFHEWTGVGADATIKTQTVGCAYELNTSTGLPYGNSNVNYLHYADLSEYDKLVVTVSAGEPRFCFNRETPTGSDADGGNVTIEFPRDKDSKLYETVKENGDGTTTYTIDIQKIVEEAGYAHLNCIKGANWTNVTVTSMKLYPIDPFTTVSLADAVSTSETVVLVKDNQVMNAPWGQYNDGAQLHSKTEFIEKSYQIKIEPVTISGASNTYTIKLKEDGEYKRYLQASTWGHAFFNANYDNDGTNCAVWTIEQMSDGKYSIRSLGVVQDAIRAAQNDGYLCVDNNGTLKIESTTPVGWEFAIYDGDESDDTPSNPTVEPITEPIDLVFTEEGSKSFDIRYFQVSGDGVSIDYNTGEVTATKAGGQIYVEFKDADLSAAQSIRLDVNTVSPYADICGTGEIFNDGTSINAWYGSKYNMQNLDKEASINNVAQDYNWNDKMGSVTRIQWNIDKAGKMKLNELIITSGVPGAEPEPEDPYEPVIAGTPRRPVDNKHPLWLIHVDVWNNADPQKIIDLIPEDIKPYVAMNLSLSCSYDDDLEMFKKPRNAIQTYRSWASVCCRNNMWFTCQPASGGRGHLPDDPAHFDETLATMESFFTDYPNFLGWNYAEQFWGFDEDSKSSSKAVDRIRLFSKLVPMHAKYGGFLTISFCGNIWSHPTNPIGMMRRNNNFLLACKDNPQAILWLYKYTTSANWYNNESVTIGPFISGLAQNYGVRYDNCGWNGAIDELVKGSNADYKNDGLPTSYPGAVGIAPVLEQSALNGACVWDGPELIWTECFKEVNAVNVDDYRSRRWGTFPNFDNIWVDMFRKIIDGTIHIPSRDEVLARTKIVMKNDYTAEQDPTSLKINAYAAPIDLYHGLYWQDDPFNARVSNEGGIGDIAGYGNNNYLYFKKTGRYATIPIVIDMFDDKANNAGITVINRSAYNANHTNKVSTFDSAYPDPVIEEGDLFVARHKNALVCYYPFSDRKKESDGTTYKTTSYAKVPFKYNTCQSMDLTFGLFSSAHVKEYSDHLDFYFNNFSAEDGYKAQKNDVIKIYGATSQPTYTVVSNRCEATITESWNDGVYTCTVTHCGPLDLRINCAGSTSRTATAMVDDTPLDANSIETPNGDDLKMQQLVIEAEDFDYKNVSVCVTDAYGYTPNWNDPNPVYPYRNVQDHSAMGFQDMGTSTAASLRHNLSVNNSGKYQISVKYMSLAEGSITVIVNGEAHELTVEKTADGINDANAWKTVVFEADLYKGENVIIINKTGENRLMVDNMTFAPRVLYVEVTISKYGYTTFCCTENYTTEGVSGITAYKAAISEDKTLVNLTPVVKVPAYEGTVMKGVANKTYYLPIIDSADPLEGNVLTGTTVRTKLDVEVYALSNQNGTNGFFKYTGEYMPANKAYISKEALGTAEVKSLMVRWNDNDASAINGVAGNSADSGRHAIYNLQGIPVAKPGKGVYIVNGRKVVFN